MTPKAALDQVAFSVGVRLMGADGRRRLRLSLARHPDLVGQPNFDVAGLEGLDALIEGHRAPTTTQDHWDLARAERERRRAPFDETFWSGQAAVLRAAGFDDQQVADLLRGVRSNIQDPQGQRMPV